MWPRSLAEREVKRRGHEPETHNKITRAQRQHAVKAAALGEDGAPVALYFQRGLLVWFEIKVDDNVRLIVS